MIEETWYYEGLEVHSVWIPSQDWKVFNPVTQARGVCFTPEGKILLIQEHKNWTIPGGSTESGETPEDTLRREVDEEATLELGECRLIGASQTLVPKSPKLIERKLFYQLRYVAIIKEMKEPTPDPCTGRIYSQKLIEPEEFNQYVQWGEIGKEMFRLAYEAFKYWKQEGHF